MSSTKRVYLDYASAAPVSRAAQKAFIDALALFGNPSSPHAEGEAAKVLLQKARTSIARLASVKPDNVIFTSGATEANNLAIQGVLHAALRNTSKLHALYLPTAHASTIQTMKAMASDIVEIEPLVITDGAIDCEALKKQIRPETVLVAVDLVCGETGTLFDVRDIRRVLDKARAHHASRILLQVDASQAPPTQSIELTHLGADFITLDAQKVGGVRGIGALIRAQARIPIDPILFGGGQEFGLRPGTENPVLATAFATALSEVNGKEARDEFSTQSKAAREQLIERLTHLFPTIQVNGGKEQMSHILNMSLPGKDTDYAVMLLSEAGFAVSTKSACETNEEGSRAVYELTKDSGRAKTTLRMSWGPDTDERDLIACADALARLNTLY